MAEFLRLDGVQADAAARALPSEPVLEELASLYKLFGDGTRLRILTLLSEGEFCVCDLARLLGATDSAVSHQLRVLKQGKLIRSRREGKVIVYALADDHVRLLLQNGLEHVNE
ncbi:MAG: helix-turn-helix transcriptional regulator [Clostridia bacterium]|nr:helix-turn-helix transcriptional regulator [Clostridia bacterium]